MLLIIEIALVVASWRRGWRWWALAPHAVGISVAALTGAMVAMLGLNISDQEFALLLLPLEGTLLVALILMATTRPHGPQAPPNPPMATPDFKLP